MHSSHNIPLSSRPSAFPSGRQGSSRRTYEALSHSKSSSGSSSESYDGPVITVRENDASFPPPAPKFPLEIKEFPSAYPSIYLWRECLAEVNLILEQQELDFNSIGGDLVRGVDEKHWKPTILIRVPEGTDKSRWRSILITIGQMLHVKNSLDFRVMIMEPEAEEYDRAFSVEAGDPLIHVWPESLKEPICELIENMDWLELSACNWGHTRNTAKPTVLIIVEEKIEEAWDDVCKKIRRICATSGLPGLQVVVEEGELTRSLNRPDSGLLQGRQSYQDKVSMGHSIGVEARGSGTLGGYLDLIDPKNPTDKTTLCLTSWDAVRPSDPTLPVEWDNRPHQYGEWPKGVSNVIHSPARSDVTSRIAYCQARIETIKNGEGWQLLELKVRDGTANERQRCLFERQAECVRDLQEKADHFKSINNKTLLRLGQCKMASGYRKASVASPDGRIRGVYALNWAIVEVDRERIGGNLLPTQDLVERVGGEDRFFLRGNTHCTSLSSIPLHAGLDVFKIGQSTGLTFGTIRRLSTYVKITRQPSSKQKAPTRTTWELYAVQGLFDIPFNRAGDSGAWVLDLIGDLVGLLWGGCEKSGQGYFTPIQLVIEDIEKFTGRKVEMYKGA